MSTPARGQPGDVIGERLDVRGGFPQRAPPESETSCRACRSLVKFSFEYLTSASSASDYRLVGARAAKDALYDGFAEIAKAMASGRRAELIDVLAQGERSVEELAGEIGQSVANTSHHLRALARAGLLTTRRDGTRIYYILASERVGELWSALRDVAADRVAGLERLADAYLGDRDGVEVIDRTELAARLKRRELVLLDVRPEAEYRAGHIAGARSVPIAELRRHLRALPKDAEVVAYCRGHFCVYADDAVRELSRRGFRARRLVDGFPEWKRAGLPVAAGGGG
jgi:rhodanese-related sulfurtransferase